MKNNKFIFRAIAAFTLIVILATVFVLKFNSMSPSIIYNIF